MAEVIRLSARFPALLGRDAAGSRGVRSAGGLQHAVAALLRRMRDTTELRAAPERSLRDIGLSRRDLGRVELPFLPPR